MKINPTSKSTNHNFKASEVEAAAVVEDAAVEVAVA